MRRDHGLFRPLHYCCVSHKRLQSLGLISCASKVAVRVMVFKPNSSVNGQLPRQPGVSKYLCLLKKVAII